MESGKRRGYRYSASTDMGRNCNMLRFFLCAPPGKTSVYLRGKKKGINRGGARGSNRRGTEDYRATSNFSVNIFPPIITFA